MTTTTKKAKSPVYPKRQIVPDWQETNNFLLPYVPQRILDLNLTHEYLEDAIDIYLVQRIEPEKLLKRNLGNDWNLFGHKEVVMAVENVNVKHTWNGGDTYWTCYYFAHGDTQQAHEYSQNVRAMMVEYADGLTATPSLWVKDIKWSEMYIFNFEEYAWTRESCAEPDVYCLTEDNQVGTMKERTYGMTMTLI